MCAHLSSVQIVYIIYTHNGFVCVVGGTGICHGDYLSMCNTALPHFHAICTANCEAISPLFIRAMCRTKVGDASVRLISIPIMVRLIGSPARVLAEVHKRDNFLKQVCHFYLVPWRPPALHHCLWGILVMVIGVQVPMALGIHRVTHSTLHAMRYCVQIHSPYDAISTPNADRGPEGGGLPYVFTWDEVIDYVHPVLSGANTGYTGSSLSFHSHVGDEAAAAACAAYSPLVAVKMPISILCRKLTVAQLCTAVTFHGLKFNRHIHIDSMRQALSSHDCDKCRCTVTLLKLTRNRKESRASNDDQGHVKAGRPAWVNLQSTSRTHLSMNPTAEFPPVPPSLKQQCEIVQQYCTYQTCDRIEVGCAICSQLTLKAEAHLLTSLDLDLDTLQAPHDVTRQERFRISDPIQPLAGPVMDHTCEYICISCKQQVKKGKMPMFALSNYMWLGDVPAQLCDLTYAEKLLVARVRHNRCVIRVKSGMHKMSANAISFANPTAKVYQTLLPPLDDLDEVLAFIFTGPCRPTEKDLRRTPLLVRRNKVGKALEWLKLNHDDYTDLNISYSNLAEYPENGSPLVMTYWQTDDVRDPENLSTNDEGKEDGTVHGPCSFVVQSLIGDDLGNKNWSTLTTLALKHLTDGGHVLAVGHAKEPQSLYNNTQLYPQMFPWLFPYGKGGLDQAQHAGLIATATHKKWLLLYHDKRFQLDPHFPLIALNHEQIKNSSAAGYILAKRKNFANIAQRLLDLDLDALSSLSSRMSAGQSVSD